MTALLEESPDAGRAVVLSAVGGSPGIGKTTLAIAWAHQVGAPVPGRAALRQPEGFDPSAPPTSPAEAVRGVLDAFDVPAERIPVELEAQAGLYRSVLAGRRVLVVLDDARDAAQVRPRRPSSTTSVTPPWQPVTRPPPGTPGARP